MTDKIVVRAAVVRVERTRRRVHADVGHAVVRLVPAGQDKAVLVLACMWKSTSELGYHVGRPEFDFHTGSRSRSSPICYPHPWLLTVAPLGRTS